MKKIILSFALMLPLACILAQPAPAQADTLRKQALNVYMEANDYIRREIPFVNNVRDIKDAGVYIITTFQRTGSGGMEYTYFLTGQNEFKGMSDTLSFVTKPDGTTDERRAQEVATLKLGLMRYIAKTPLAQYMNIAFSQPIAETVSTDKWNSWVLRASVNGNLRGQKTSSSTNFSGNISANRITENWKVNLNAMYSSSKDKFEIGPTTITSDNKSNSLNGLVVKSLSDHWSLGGSAFLSSSSFSNEKLNATIMPGIEYDLFPYSESTRRQMRVLYSIGFRHIDFIDTTIYNKIEENLWRHSLSLAYEVVQKWGSVDLTADYSNYLHDWSKNNLSLSGSLDLRIAKGLSMNLRGSISLIHDQLGLVKGDIPTEQILLRRQEMETRYEYRANFGFTYTFGSIYNNVVNPRFGNQSSYSMYF